MFQSMFQSHISIYVSITSVNTKRIILFQNYNFVSRVSFTSVLLKFYWCFRSHNYWLVWVFFTSDTSLVRFIVINHILISDWLYLFIYLFIYLFLYLCIYFSLSCIFIVYILLLCIALHCSCICTLLYITLHAPAYALSYVLYCMPLHMHFPMHCIASLCICTFLCIALHSPAYAPLHALHAPAYY